MASEAAGPEPERLLLVGWFRLLVLTLLSNGLYGAYWHVRRARELAALGAEALPLQLAAGLVVALTAFGCVEPFLPPLVASRDAELGLTIGLGLVEAAAALVYARALQQLGARCPGLSTFFLQSFYVEWRLWFLPAVLKRRWEPRDRGPAAIAVVAGLGLMAAGELLGK